MRENARADLVTDADYAAQVEVYSYLQGVFPTHGFVGEEDTPGIVRGQPAADAPANLDHRPARRHGLLRTRRARLLHFHRASGRRRAGRRRHLRSAATGDVRCRPQLRSNPQRPTDAGQLHLDGYWAIDNHVWDVAASVILVQEAGGNVTRADGAKLDAFQPDILAQQPTRCQSTGFGNQVWAVAANFGISNN